MQKRRRKAIKEVLINKNDSGQRLDKFLQKTLPSMPTSLLLKSIRKGRVKLNSKKLCDFRYVLNEGDVLSLYINDEFFEASDDAQNFLKAPSEIDIVYEDENILLVNKMAGLAVHDFDGGSFDTLINRIIHYLYKKGEYNPQSENSFVPALCNRIDRNTCGIVIAAKNAEALRIMNEQIKERNVIKKYLCLVHGAPPKKEDEVTVFLKKINDKNICLVSDKKKDGYKTAVTKYKVLKKNHSFALLEVELKTGRTHQIRATFSHLGCALLGDGKYGVNYSEDKRLGFKHQALCSYYVGFNFKNAEALSYLDKKSFALSDVWFKNYID